jgi:hypothetical protein
VAHFEFTRINIAPTILYKKIEDVREAGANVATSANWGQANSAVDPLIASCVLEEWGHEAGYRLKFAGVSAARIASTIAAGGRIVSTFGIGRAM